MNIWRIQVTWTPLIAPPIQRMQVTNEVNGLMSQRAASQRSLLYSLVPYRSIFGTTAILNMRHFYCLFNTKLTHYAFKLYTCWYVGICTVELWRIYPLSNLNVVVYTPCSMWHTYIYVCHMVIHIYAHCKYAYFL